MSIKHALLLSAVLIGFVVSPTYSGDIISCDSFENCPDGSNPVTQQLLDMQARIEELEAEVIARTANLSGADLSGAELFNAELRFANLRGAKFAYAKLSGADLTGADLFFATLTGADLTGADLTGADLTDAAMEAVIWSNTTCPDGSNSDTNGLNACVALP